MKKNSRKNESEKDINIISAMKAEFEHFSGVLEERLIKEVKTVAEGHGGIVKTLDKIETELSGIKSELHTVKSELHTVKMAVMDTGHRVDQIEKKLGENLQNQEKRITKLEEKVLV